jgi:hypothetical protein
MVRSATRAPSASIGTTRQINPSMLRRLPPTYHDTIRNAENSDA